jgi:hypothetical protein
VVMPNHVHGIIEIAVVPNVGAGLRPARSLIHDPTGGFTPFEGGHEPSPA